MANASLGAESAQNNLAESSDVTQVRPLGRLAIVDQFDHLEDRLAGITSLLWLLGASSNLDVTEARAIRSIHDQIELLLNGFQDANAQLSVFLGFKNDAPPSPARDMQARAEEAMCG